MEIGNELPGLKLRNLFIGGLLKKDGTVQAGFTGCMQVYSHKHTFTLFGGVCIVLFTWVRHVVISQGVRMGETSTNTANINIRHATRIRAKDGCNVPDACQSNLCPSHSRCTDNWASLTCVCEPGNTSSATKGL